MSLHITEFMPDGSTLMRDADFYDRLAYGDATVGWIGDPRLAVYWNNGHLEIMRQMPNGSMKMIARSPYGCNTLDTGLLRWLAEHDSQSRRAYNVADDIDQHNAKVDRANEDAMNEQIAEAADRLAFALKRESNSRFIYPSAEVPKA